MRRTGNSLALVWRFLARAVGVCSPLRMRRSGVSFRLWRLEIVTELLYVQCAAYMLVLSLAADFTCHVLADPWSANALLSRMRSEAVEIFEIMEWSCAKWGRIRRQSRSAL